MPDIAVVLFMNGLHLNSFQSIAESSANKLEVEQTSTILEAAWQTQTANKESCYVEEDGLRDDYKRLYCTIHAVLGVVCLHLHSWSFSYSMLTLWQQGMRGMIKVAITSRNFWI